MKLRHLIPVCCFLAVTLVMAGPPAETAGTLTVGDFVVKLAGALSPGAVQDVTDARSFFATRGTALPSDLDLAAPLTEMDVTVVSGLLGLDVNTASPEKAFDADAADGYIGFLREEIDSGRLSPQSSAPEDQELFSGTDANQQGGACCQAGVCSIQTRVNCNFAGGVFRGQLIGCSPDPCEPGDAACCLAPNVCVISMASQCPGFFQGTAACKRKTCRLFDIKDPTSPTEP